MDKVEKRRAFLINFAFVGVLLALAYVGLKYFFWVSAPFLLSFFFAVILQKPLRFIDKKTNHKAHGFFSILLVILSICVVIIPLIFILSAVFNKISEFLTYLVSELNDLPSLLSKVENWLLDFLGFLPSHLYDSVSVTITDAFSKLQPAAAEDVGAASGLLSGIDFSSITDKITSGVSNVYSVLKGVPSVLIGVVIGIVAWILFTKDYDTVVRFIQNQLPSEKKNILVDLKQVFSKTILTMFKAYGIIMLITFSEICLGFGIMRMCGIMNNNFFVLIAAAIAIFDILPVAGSGGILIPWALFSLVYGNNKQALGLIIMYVIITVIRQYIEPKIVGTSLGVNPIVTLMGLYFGLKFFGFLGMFLVPLCVMTLKAFNDTGRINIWKTSPENKIDVPKK
ncbi:AI-2E family transporter [uncultured Eubacterium sp.]|uniref:AI-2E family transporter n=1 Tax=uncultured Eubacterium sp. TaxID=165185 RepID=UPI0015A7B147|nr:AI-2E family transporter [uncultured Eubacterium sp.]